MKKIISLFMATIMLLSCINVSAFANQESSESISTDVEDTLLSESALSAESNDISIKFNVTDKWTGGFNGSITVENVSNEVIENWQIQFEFPHEIINIWNAQIISYENGIYNIKNAGGNNAVNIPVGESVSFGFIGTYEDEIFEPENVKLISGSSTADTTNYSVDFNVLSDWGSGFSAEITITNNTELGIMVVDQTGTKAKHLLPNNYAEKTQLIQLQILKN